MQEPLSNDTTTARFTPDNLPYQGPQPSTKSNMVAAIGTDPKAISRYLNANNPDTEFVAHNNKIYYAPTGTLDDLLSSDGGNSIDENKLQMATKAGRINEFNPGIMANLVSTVPTTLGSIAGAAIGAPAGPVGVIGGAGIGAGVGNMGKQALGTLLGVDTRQLGADRAKELALNTGLGAGAEALGPALGMIGKLTGKIEPGIVKASLSPSQKLSELLSAGGKIPVGGEIGKGIGKAAEFLTPDSSSLKQALRIENDNALKKIVGEMDTQLFKAQEPLEDITGSIGSQAPQAPVNSSLNETLNPSLEKRFMLDNQTSKDAFKDMYSDIRNKLADDIEEGEQGKMMGSYSSDYLDKYNVSKPDLIKKLRESQALAKSKEADDIYEKTIDQVTNLPSTNGKVRIDDLMDAKNDLVNLPYKDADVYRQIVPIRKTINDTIQESLNQVDGLGDEWKEVNAAYGTNRDFAEPLEKRIEGGSTDSGLDTLKKFRQPTAKLLPNVKETGGEFSNTMSEYSRALAAEMKQNVMPNKSIDYEGLNKFINSKNYPYLKQTMDASSVDVNGLGKEEFGHFTVPMKNLDTLGDLAKTGEYTGESFNAGSALDGKDWGIMHPINTTSNIVKSAIKTAGFPMSAIAYNPENFIANTIAQRLAKRLTPNKSNQDSIQNSVRSGVSDISKGLIDKLKANF